MRALLLAGFLLCGCGFAGAQESGAAQGPPGVVVVKYGWAKERVNWEKDPFGGPVESFQDMNRRVGWERSVEAAKKSGPPGEVSKLEQAARTDRAVKARPTRPPRYAFSYKLSVRNTGARAVKEVDWDYVFLDAATGEELGRRQFTSAVKVAPGKRKEFSLLVPSPPTHRISVYALGKREHEGLREQVVLTRVLYEDGTVWRRP